MGNVGCRGLLLGLEFIASSCAVVDESDHVYVDVSKPIGACELSAIADGKVGIAKR